MEATLPRLALWLSGYELGRLDLVSPLGRDECVRRLRAKIGSGWIAFGSGAIAGDVATDSFSITARWWYQTFWGTVLRGTFVEGSRRTHLHCRFGGPIGFVVAMTVLLAWLVIAGGGAIVRITLGSSSAWPFGPVLFFLFGTAIILVLRVFALDQKDVLVKFLINTLDAQEVPPSDS